MTTVGRAFEDSRLRAIISPGVPLLYEHRGNPPIDCPEHVRAASGIVWFGDELALIQDDANFIALLDPVSSRARAIALPPGEGGARLFDRDRGNKQFKLDLEACVTVELRGAPALLAFGSGSTARREVVARVSLVEGEDAHVEIVELPRFYAALRDTSGFAGSEMNVEGAVILGDRLRLFSRGNGRSTGELVAIDASCDLDLAELLAHLDAPRVVPPPIPMRVRSYDLGAIDGVRLGFTDATVVGGWVYYAAAAEASPDALEDGAVLGSVIGVLDEMHAPRYAVVTDAAGQRFAGKIEGIVSDPSRLGCLFAVADMDDPRRSAELCRVELIGAWTA